MTILITGGNGYIARNLTRLLSMKGFNILSPSHSELDICNLQNLRHYLSKHKIECIIHTATKGGKRNVPDTYEDFVSNITMFENIVEVADENIKIISFGSGAEFDRRKNICLARTSDIFESWPIDPYGLSKNIISRRSTINMWVLRLFGCFNYDENDSRFIKNSILRVKEGLPIEIHQNRKMDFFFLDDIIPVIKAILSNENIARHINLVYNTKYSLSSIANLIHTHMGTDHDQVNIIHKELGNDYTGDDWAMKTLQLPLIGFEEGLIRTINILK